MIGSIIQPPDLTNSHTVNAPSEKGRHSIIGAQGAHLPKVRELAAGFSAVALQGLIPHPAKTAAARAHLP
ncbi:hypothetical protein MBA34_26360, partial [Pseudomonas capeferrum]|uniref:hypothetical protein n=1 Tax=Pseudomonas capeferrum TaxID=1495066 RepID=UPI001F4B4FD5